MATQNTFVLTESDVSLLKDMAQIYKNRRLNPQLTEESPQVESTDIYIAYPEDVELGIPELTPAGTWQDDDGNDVPQFDEPGVGSCRIYQIVQGAMSELGVEDVYNIRQAPIVEDYFIVIRDKYGDLIAQPIEETFEAILIQELEPATGPLTGATEGLALVIQKNYPITADVAQFAKSSIIRGFYNRALSMKGSAGTYGQFKRLNGETRLEYLDCAPSEEGVQIIIEYEEGLVLGGSGSGGYGDGTYGG